MGRDLQHFIARLEQCGELLRVKCEVSSQFEITEIVDRISKSDGGGKAILFENVKDSQFPLAINLLGSEKRIAMAMGVDSLAQLTERVDEIIKEATSPKNSLMDKLRALPTLAQVAKWLPSCSSSRGVCQQVVLTDEQAKLRLLPILKCWPYDGGAFVTLPTVHTVDPDSGCRNVGMYRMQVFDDHTTGMHWHIHKTGARHYEAYKRRGERMPVSVALGGDPTYFYSATAPMPDNMDEYLLAGFLRMRRVNLVKCLTNNIYVPEDCDFVIEGYVDPSEERVVEGPFGDHTGFYSLQDYYPRFHVTAITHRRDAIYPATIVGVPPQEDAYIAMATERIFLSPIRFVMQPEVVDMTMPVEGVAHNIALFSMQKRYLGEAHKVVQSMWGAGQMMFNKYQVVIDAVHNVRDNDTMAALLRRADIPQSLITSQGVLDVLDHATATCGFGGKLALDLTDVNINGECAAQSWQIEDSRFIVRDDFAQKWGVLALFADPKADIDRSTIVERLGIKGVNFVAVFDAAAANLSASDLLWLASANSDPRRDVELQGVTLVVDARSKVPSVGANPARFPNVVTSSEQTVALVDSRWAEYGLGDFVESPSRKYRALELSQREDW